MEHDIKKRPFMFLNDSYIHNDHKDETHEHIGSGEKVDKTSDLSDLDLELAAEIGKALLERNRELEMLLHTAHEYTEEQILRAQFFEQQVDFLKESLQNQTKLSEQLESQNHELSDNYTQLKCDYKALSSKTKRLWETIETLEKKCENYRCQIDLLEEEQQFLSVAKEHSVDAESESDDGGNSEDRPNLEIDEEYQSLTAKARQSEDKINELQETVKDLRVQQNMDQIEKEELKAELEDISTDNQLLQHRISNLECEIEEWQRFANKANKYKKLADRYSSDVNIAFYGSTSHFEQGKSRSSYPILKSCSHEVLNNAPLCDTSELLASTKNISASVTHLYQPPKNLSVLSEMDNQYHELVKRYEQLLDKYRNNENNADQHSRAQKVQRAIQTLSWDFSNMDIHVKPPSPKRKTSFDEEKSPDEEEDDATEESCLDFRRMFVEIFAKLRETKDFSKNKKA